MDQSCYYTNISVVILSFLLRQKSPALNDYLTLLHDSASTPKTAFMSVLIPTVASVLGTNTKVDILGSSFPLNMFTVLVTKPGGGKSAAFGIVQKSSNDMIKEKLGVDIIVENFTLPGLRTHHNKNQNYCLLTADEGVKILEAIFKPKHENDLKGNLCKYWNGYGDKSALKDGVSSFDSTTCSMSILIQPKILFNDYPELCCPEGDGLTDRILFMASNAHKIKSNAIRAAAAHQKEKYPHAFIPTIICSIFEAHQSKGEIIYNFNEEAQAYFDEIHDEGVDDFNAQNQLNEGN